MKKDVGYVFREPLKEEKHVGYVFRDRAENTGNLTRTGAPGRKTYPTCFYFRLHGRNRAAWWQHEATEDRYNYLYSPDELEPVAEIARDAAASGRRVLMYMNNHFSAKSVANAVILKRKLGEPIPGDYPPALVDKYPELQGVVATSGLPL